MNQNEHEPMIIENDVTETFFFRSMLLTTKLFDPSTDIKAKISLEDESDEFYNYFSKSENDSSLLIQETILKSAQSHDPSDQSKFRISHKLSEQPMLPLTVESFENNEILYLDISSTTTPNNMLKYALINESEDSPVNELKPEKGFPVHTPYDFDNNAEKEVVKCKKNTITRRLVQVVEIYASPEREKQKNEIIDGEEELRLNREFYNRNENKSVEPPFHLIWLMQKAILESHKQRATPTDIENWIFANFCYYRKINYNFLKNALRRNLYAHRFFVNSRVKKVAKDAFDVSKKEYEWTINQTLFDKNFGFFDKSKRTGFRRTSNASIEKENKVNSKKPKIKQDCSSVNAVKKLVVREPFAELTSDVPPQPRSKNPVSKNPSLIFTRLQKRVVSTECKPGKGDKNREVSESRVLRSAKKN